MHNKSEKKNQQQKKPYKLSTHTHTHRSQGVTLLYFSLFHLVVRLNDNCVFYFMICCCCLSLSCFVSFICRLNIVTGMQKPHNECINTKFSATILLNLFRVCLFLSLFFLSIWHLHLKLIRSFHGIYSLTWNYLNLCILFVCFVPFIWERERRKKCASLSFDASLHIAGAWHTPMSWAKEISARPLFDD